MKFRVQMAKVTQMLDAGWEVVLYKNRLETYTAMAHRRVKGKITRQEVITDDFAPEQALTRLAYKVHGEILK